MITLIFSFYVFLFSTNAPVQPDCVNKLKELNYTYEYNLDPFRDRPIARDRYSRHYSYRDTITREVALEVKSIYNCFKLALDADTNKVLVITYNPLAHKVKPKDDVPEMYHQRNLGIHGMVSFYGLENYTIYSAINYEWEGKFKYKLELLDKTNSKLKSEEVRLHEECKNCPF